MLARRLVSDFDSILRARLYNFLRKNVWKYLFCTIIIGLIHPIDSLGNLASILLYFVGLILAVLILIYISSSVIAKKVEFDADVEFNENSIIIRHRNKDLKESKPWSWVKKIVNHKDRIWIEIDNIFPLIISFPKVNLTESEINFLLTKI